MFLQKHIEGEWQAQQWVMFYILRNDKLVSNADVPLCIPTSDMRCLQLSPSLATHSTFRLFNFSYSRECIVIFLCDFKSHSPSDQLRQYLFTCILVICVSSLVKCLFKAFFLSFCYSTVRLLRILRTQVYVRQILSSSV